MARAVGGEKEKELSERTRGNARRGRRGGKSENRRDIDSSKYPRFQREYGMVLASIAISDYRIMLCNGTLFPLPLSSSLSLSPPFPFR